MIDPVAVIQNQLLGQYYPPGKWNFDPWNIEISPVGLTYGDLTVRNLKPVGIQSSIFENDTDATDIQTFTVSKTTSDSFSWSLKEGIKVATKFKASIPFVGDSESSVELSFDSTQTTTTSVTRSWQYSAQIPVPPHSKIIVTFAVLEGQIDTAYTATVQAYGNTTLNFDIARPGEPADWRCIAATLPDDIGSFGITLQQVQCVATGQFNGVAATTYSVTVKNASDDGLETEIDRGTIWDKPAYLGSDALKAEETALA